MSSISAAGGSAGESSLSYHHHPPKTGFAAGETTTRIMTPPSDDDPNNKTKNNNKLPSYPTGATVPFPFATPYPQQVDLMESLLQGVKHDAGGDDNHHSTTKLVMLESPTGKLLSKQMVLSLSYFI